MFLRNRSRLVARASPVLYCTSTNIPTVVATSSTNMVQGRRPTYEGIVTEWNPFERRGKIQLLSDPSKEYIVSDTRAFETVLPTMLRTLEGARVVFDVEEAPTSNRVIIRNKLTPITAESYNEKPPVNFMDPGLLAARTRPPSPPEGEADVGRKAKDSPVPSGFAKNIIVNMNSIPQKQIARLSGPLVEEEVIQPTKNLKDMRSSRLFDKNTNDYLRLARRIGSVEEAKRLTEERIAAEEAAAPRREVVSTSVRGMVLAWSGIHRSGVIIEGLVEPPRDGDAPLQMTQTEAMSIIRNVYAFQSALPTSQNLLHRRVCFTKVQYSTQPGKSFAEEIVVEGEVRYDAALPSVEEAHKAIEEEKREDARRRQFGRLVAQEEDTPSSKISGAAEPSTPSSGEDSTTAPEVTPPVVGPLYGVITRWSGGQGVVESGDGRHYFLQSAADFVQLVDQSSHTIRGAVVQFRVDDTNPRYAREVDVLSTASSTIGEMRPFLEKKDTDKEGSAAAPATTHRASAGDVEPEGVEWTFGTLISWSPLEGQGIIHTEDGGEQRVVLRDADENVIAYKSRKDLLQKGRKVKFTRFGSTGRLACNVVLLDTEADEAALREEELRPKEPELSLDGNMNEAIASPMSTTYWLNRMDKAGYDTREVKELQNRALTLDEDEADDGTEGGKFLDSDDLLKNDPWWSDPRKNIKFPNSDITAGHLSLMGPASMMNVAMKAKDPKKLDNMVKKYQSRLTEEQKEYAWKQAKEMAPKYEECIKKARERNEEPKFYFF